ncbi:hypothetical protein [Brevundimonas sp.]|uniref:hypothetical protein n=1 Tax=Brevundimonas sp. TaxID=1871086 RepID=UPI00391DF744
MRQFHLAGGLFHVKVAAWRGDIMLLVVLGCIALAPRGAEAEALPMNERIALNTAEAVACVRHYEDRIRAGEDLRITPDLPGRDRSAILTARANLSMSVYDRNDSGGLDREEWLQKDWDFELLYDVDRDLRVSREEYLTGRLPPRNTQDAGLRDFQNLTTRREVSRFNRLSDGGEFLQRSRLARESAMTFRAHDLDRDGEITPSDVSRLSRGEFRR